MMRRRSFITAILGLPLLQNNGFGAEILSLTWSDLLPDDVGYAPIVDEGYRDEANDIWRPVFGEGADEVVNALDGQRVSLPGFMVPLDFSSEGTKSFLLAPFAGACIHVPPPPPNQIVYASSDAFVPFYGMMQPVRVTGVLHIEGASTTLATAGYALAAEWVEKHLG